MNDFYEAKARARAEALAQSRAAAEYQRYEGYKDFSENQIVSLTVMQRAASLVETLKAISACVDAAQQDFARVDGNWSNIAQGCEERPPVGNSVDSWLEEAQALAVRIAGEMATLRSRIDRAGQA